MADDTELKDKQEAQDDPKKLRDRWLEEIKHAEKRNTQWWEKAKKVVDRYKDERQNSELDTAMKMNIFWSNIKTLQPALYARTPKPVVFRRFTDQDPVARIASQILERSLAYMIEQCDFDETMKLVRDDYLLSGRGTAKLRYVPEYGDEIKPDVPLTVISEGVYKHPESGSIIKGEDSVQEDKGQFFEKPFSPLVFERIAFDFVHHRDFVHDDAPTWKRVTWLAFGEDLSKTSLEQRFGYDIACEIPTHKTRPGAEKEVDNYYGTARVWEVWDKERREVIWVCEGYKDGPLDVKKDPLGLRDFFPCPPPIYSTLGLDNLIPVPDYCQYQDQAMQMDELTGKLDGLLKQVRTAGVYDASVPEIGIMLQSSSGNTYVPSAQFNVLKERGGVKGAFDSLPIEETVGALKTLLEARTVIKQDLYEVTGISDIIRGQSDPRETATAQRIKGNFGTLRLQDRQQDVARFCRDVIAIQGEIMCGTFQETTLLAISGFDKKAQEEQMAGFGQQPQMPQQPQGPPPQPPPQGNVVPFPQQAPPPGPSSSPDPGMQQVAQALMQGFAGMNTAIHAQVLANQQLAESVSQAAKAMLIPKQLVVQPDGTKIAVPVTMQ